MKIKDGFVLKELSGSYLVVPLGSQVTDFAHIIKLTETSAFLWKKLESECEVEDLISALLQEYDVDRETATKGVNSFVSKLKESNLLMS